MEPLTVAVGGLALAVMGHGVLWFFKTPRQEAADLVTRIAQGELEHRQLERDFIKSSATLGVKVDQLGVEVSGLTVAVKELTRRMDNGGAHTRRSRHDTAPG